MAFGAFTPDPDEQRRIAEAQAAAARGGTYGAVNPNPGTTPVYSAQGAVQTTPTAQAAQQRGLQQSQDVGYRNQQGNVQTESAGRGGVYNQSAARSRDQAMPFKSSNEWFGGLDEYGGIAASQSPGLLFDLYGTEVLGLNAGSATGQFYGQNYNPYAMGRALGQDLNTPDAAMAAGTWMANQLGQPGMTFFDPGRIVTSALSQLAAAGNGGVTGGEFDFMSSLVAAGTTPDQQLDAVLSFLGEALKGAMAPDVLGAYMNWLQTVGMDIVNQVMTSKAQGGGLAEFERNGGNIATALLQRIGPNGGL